MRKTIQFFIKKGREILAAFSMYSRLPVPDICRAEDYENVICHLPLVGFVIGALEYAWYQITVALELPLFSGVLIAMGLPIFITGGFHADGYADVCDALGSHADLEKKLAILHDPHIGAFAVIGLIKMGILYAAALYILYWKKDDKSILLFALSFVLARALATATSVKLSHAQNHGMLSLETKRAGTAAFLLADVEVAALLIVMLFLHPQKTVLLAIVTVLCVFYYCGMTKKHFGGVSGDTAGFFIAVFETTMVLALAVTECIPFS